MNITVTTPAGTSAVSAADQYTYTGSGTSTAPTITSADQATFSSGTAEVFDITTTGAPGVSAVSDTAFSGCTPSTLPASITLHYTGGTTASLDGTPQRATVASSRSASWRRTAWHPRHPGLHAHRQGTVRLIAPATTAPPPQHGYWLVGSDGGIFTFGSADFYGSTGSLHLQRPIVGITPTANRGGYWLVASDGGIFAFGNANYYGSAPGSGLTPAGSGLPHSLNAPIVGMVPSHDGAGLLHGRIRRRRVRVRRRPLRGIVPRNRRLPRRGGGRRA